MAVTRNGQQLRAVNAIPAGVSVLMPMLVCRDPAREIDFCKAVFGAVEVNRRPGPDGAVAHAAMTIYGAMFMIEAEWPGIASRAPILDGSSPVILYVYVDDVDAVVERAVIAGATVISAAKNQFWGDRTARIADPVGHVWIISSRVEETSAAERTERWSKIVKS
jgi:PhnB protein